jgi:hypothetical protein
VIHPDTELRRGKPLTGLGVFDADPQVGRFTIIPNCGAAPFMPTIGWSSAPDRPHRPVRP